VIFCNSSYSQKSCFEEAVAYRFQYLNRTPIEFDSLLIYLKKGQEMLIGCTFPNDTFTTVNNKHLALDSFAGKILVINFWSVHCPPCVNEIVSFHELQKKYKNLVVLAFTLDSKKEVTEFLKKNSFNARIVAEANSFVEKYSLGSGYPFTLLTDGARKIVYVKSGGKTGPENQMDLFNELSPYIDQILKNK
jgi:thiol-disulfide isomerase/thioredoxin